MNWLFSELEVLFLFNHERKHYLITVCSVHNQMIERLWVDMFLLIAQMCIMSCSTIIKTQKFYPKKITVTAITKFGNCFSWFSIIIGASPNYCTLDLVGHT